MSFLILDDFTVPGFGLNVSVSEQLKSEDASGESSSTATAKKGNKGKKLEVRLSLRFRHADDLRQLMRVAEATSGKDGKVYTITREDAFAKAKMEQYEQTLKFNGLDEIAQKTVKCRFPIFRELPADPERMTQGELAAYVRSIIEEDIYG